MNEFARFRLMNYIKNYGVKSGFVANQIGLSQSHFSMFKNRHRDMSKKSVYKLMDYLDSMYGKRRETSTN